MTKNKDILKQFEVIERQTLEVENVVEKNKYFTILFFSQLYTQLDTCQNVHPCACVYINDLETHVPLFKYVDDSTLFEICNTKEISEIQESIDKAADWTSMNCMKINSKKSKEMIISFTQDVNFKKSVPNIIIDGNPVEVVKHAKLLGVILSDDLTWNMHVDSIVKKAAKRVYMLYQLKRAGIRQTDLVNVYVSVVRPVLEYACPVWHTNLTKYLSDNIEMIQKRALKSIFPNKGYLR